MDLVKITDLTNQLRISSRSLRYYEEVGLIQSNRLDFDKYRYYDTENIERLKQIMILRKMQIPIKDIIRIYESEDMSVVVETFINRINSIDDEVNALYELRRIVNTFLQVMIKNGIKRISALPLIYEEMDKQLEIGKNFKPVTYKELSEVSEKLAKPLDIRIVELIPTRVLSSYLKADNKQKSDIGLFQKWLADNGIPEGKSGAKEKFDYIDTETNDYVSILKITDDYINNSPFIDFIFEGGLFASIGTYQGDDMGKAYDSLKSYMENKSESYVIDYPYINRTHIDCLGEEVLSPFDDRAKYDIYMPIKRRVNNMVVYKHNEIVDDIAVEELEKTEEILATDFIDLNTMVSEAWQHYVNDNNELYVLANMDFQGTITKEKYKIPFRIDVTVKAVTDNSIRLYWGKGAVILNWENNSSELRIHDPYTGRQYGHKNKGNIPVGEYVNISWIVGDEYFAVIVNGYIRHAGRSYEYMQTLRSESLSHPIRIGSNSRDLYTSFILLIKSIKISKLKPKQKFNFKKGELAIMQKKSNNILPKVRDLTIGHLGENYPFNGCMRYLMECIGRGDLAEFWLSALVTGDNFTFVYTPEKGGGGDTCVTERLCGDDDEEYIKYVFDMYGYDCTLITANQINSNKKLFIDMVINYIDQGIPVFMSGYCRPICGYEDNGRTLITLNAFGPELEKFDTTQEIGSHFIFLGDKKRDVTAEEIYRKAIMSMPRIYHMEKEGCYFGHKGFIKWADDIENGKYDAYTKDSFDVWEHYTVYIVNLATNVSGGFGRDLIKRFPDLTFIKDIDVIYSEMNNLYQELNNMGAAFSVTLEALQDRQKRKEIADKIREIGLINQQLLTVFENAKMN